MLTKGVGCEVSVCSHLAPENGRGPQMNTELWSDKGDRPTYMCTHHIRMLLVFHSRYVAVVLVH
jgi:hypothetical protein